MPHLETKQDRLEYLKRLYSATNNACELAAKHRTGGAVNWADLHCCGAEYRMREDGDEYLRYIAQRLSDAGFIDIQVEPEW